MLHRDRIRTAASTAPEGTSVLAANPGGRDRADFDTVAGICNRPGHTTWHVSPPIVDRAGTAACSGRLAPERNRPQWVPHSAPPRAAYKSQRRSLDGRLFEV